MAVGPQFGLHIHFQLQGLVAVVQPILLHRDLGVAQHILFLGQFALGIQYFEVEIAVAQFHDDVALVYVSTLIDHLFEHYATLLGRNLHHLNGHHPAIHVHIVVKFGLFHFADAQATTLDFQRRTVI